MNEITLESSGAYEIKAQVHNRRLVIYIETKTGAFTGISLKITRGLAEKFEELTAMLRQATEG